MTMDWIRYCNFCNADVSAGVLTVQDESGNVFDMDACATCAGRVKDGTIVYEY